MRLSVAFGFLLIAHVFAQVEPEHTTDQPDWPSPTITESSTSTPTWTGTSAEPPTITPPSCVQACMIQISGEVGCRDRYDFECICASKEYLTNIRQCYKGFGCEEGEIQGAERSYAETCKGEPDMPTFTDETSPSESTTTFPTVIAATMTESDQIRGFTGGSPTSVSSASNKGARRLNWSKRMRVDTMVSLGVAGGFVLLFV